jgi:hypothetical protein
MADKHIEIRNPRFIMFEGPDGTNICHIHPGELSYGQFGMLVCDLVRHIAAAFKVEEDDVWAWVDKERRHPTTKVSRPS